MHSYAHICITHTAPHTHTYTHTYTHANIEVTKWGEKETQERSAAELCCRQQLRHAAIVGVWQQQQQQPPQHHEQLQHHQHQQPMECVRIGACIVCKSVDQLLWTAKAKCFRPSTVSRQMVSLGNWSIISLTVTAPPPAAAAAAAPPPPPPVRAIEEIHFQIQSTSA